MKHREGKANVAAAAHFNGRRPVFLFVPNNTDPHRYF